LVPPRPESRQTIPLRLAESRLLLGALDAQTVFGEALIGDLAEEFAVRAERDGGAAARRWYYREAVRVAPHLLRDCVRGFHRRDVAHVASVVGLSYVCTATIGLFIFFTINSVTLALGLHLESIDRFLTHPYPIAVTILLLLLGSTGAVLGGYIAACLDRRTPVVSAMSLGVAWTCLALASSAIVHGPPTPPPVPSWYRFAAVALVIVGTSAGGVLRVCGARSIRRENASVAGGPALS
jgi:hypothetical protein